MSWLLIETTQFIIVFIIWIYWIVTFAGLHGFVLQKLEQSFPSVHI